MSHVGLRLRNCSAVHWAGVHPPGLLSTRRCWKNYQNKAGFSNTVDDIYRTLLLQTVVGVSATQTYLFLPTGVGSFWVLFFFFFFNSRTPLTRARSHFNAVKSLSLQQGLRVVFVHDVPYQSCGFPLPGPFVLSITKKEYAPILPLFVLQLLCFHSNTWWIFQRKSTSVLDPASFNSFKHFKVCVC